MGKKDIAGEILWCYELHLTSCQTYVGLAIKEMRAQTPVPNALLQTLFYFRCILERRCILTVSQIFLNYYCHALFSNDLSLFHPVSDRCTCRDQKDKAIKVTIDIHHGPWRSTVILPQSFLRSPQEHILMHIAYASLCCSLPGYAKD